MRRKVKMLISLRISLRNLIRKKYRTLFTLLAMVIGIASMFAVISTVETAKKMTEDRLKLYLGNADYSILSTKGTFSEVYLDKIFHTEGVDHALGLMHRRSQVELKEERSKLQSRLRITGLSSLDSNMLHFNVLKGNLNEEGIIIPKETAELWKVNIGDTVMIHFPSGKKNIKIIAIVQNTPLLEGPNDWQEADNKIWRAAASLSLVQKWYMEEHRIDEVRIKYDQNFQASHITNEIEKELLEKDLYLQKVILDEKQTNQLDDLYFMLYAVGGLAMLISAFILYNTLYVNVMERRNEIAIMKTIGYTTQQIKQLFLSEVLILSVLGIVIGIPIGSILSKFLQQSLFSSFQENLTFQMQYAYTLPTVVTLGILIPLIAALLPLKFASKVDIISNLKNTPKESKSNPKWRLAIGLVLLVGAFLPNGIGIICIFIAIFFLAPYITQLLLNILTHLKLLGYEGKVAVNNSKRTLNRSASMSLILAFVICLGLLVSSIFSSIEKNIDKDLSKSFGGNIQLSFEAPLSDIKMESIKKAINGYGEFNLYPEKIVGWERNNEPRQFTIISADTNWYKKYPLFYKDEQSNSSILNQLEKENNIVLGEYAFREWGGKIGENITVFDNNKRYQFKVIGKVTTTQHSGYTAFVSKKIFDQNFKVIKPTKGLINVRDPEEEQQFKNSLVDKFSNEISDIQSIKEEAKKQQDTLSGIKPLFNILIIIAILVAGIGILNSLIISILDRLREIGVMRAVAFTNYQIHKMIIIEGVIIGIIGVFIGIVLGLVTSYLNAQTISDSQIDFVLPIDTLIMSVFSGIFISILAAFMPAYKATKIKLIDSLKQE